MKRRINGEQLDVDGLNYHERLTRLERSLYGTEHVAGLVDRYHAQQERLQELESTDRRRRLPFFFRWFLPAREEKPSC